MRSSSRLVYFSMFVVVGLSAATCMARRQVLSSEQRAAQERLSTHWLPEFQRIAHNEVMFGDGKLDPHTVRLLAALTDRYKLQNPNRAKLFEQTFWRLMISMQLDIENDAKLENELRLMAKQARDILDASIFQARYQSGATGLDEDASALKVIGEAKLLGAGGDVDLENDQIGRAVVYLVVLDGANSKALQQLMDKKELLPFVVDACSLNPVAPKVRDAVINVALRTTDRAAHQSLVSLIVQKEPTEAKELLDKLRDTLPQKTIRGQRVFVLSTGSRESAVHRAIWKAYGLVDLKERYLEARAGKRTTTFFRNKEKNGDLAKIKAWLLYRYHPANFAVLFDDLRTSSQVVAGDNWYPKMLLATTLKFASLVPTEGIKPKAVRKYAADAKTPEDKVNALVLLKAIVANEDIPVLRQMATDASDVTWEASGKQYHAPLVAIGAVQCLSELHSPASISALNRIVRDTSVPQKARALALQTLQTQAGGQSDDSPRRRKTESRRRLPRGDSSKSPARSMPPPDRSGEPTPSRAEDRGENFSKLDTKEVVRRLTTSDNRVEQRKGAKRLSLSVRFRRANDESSNANEPKPIPSFPCGRPIEVWYTITNDSDSPVSFAESDPDTFNLAVLRDIEYAGYGDGELRVMMDARGRVGVVAEDWNYGGKQW